MRMSSARVRHTLIKLKLLELGNISQYESFDELLTTPVVFDDMETSHASDIESKLCEYERQYAQMINVNNEIRKYNASTSFHNHKKLIKQNDVTYKTIQRNVVDNFFKSAIAMKKCENCGAFSPAFRKDGFTKIFQKPLNKRVQKQMRAMRKKLQVRKTFTGLHPLYRGQRLFFIYFLVSIYFNTVRHS
jgi:DNA-directed RNA polymerase I subunit RPA1